MRGAGPRVGVGILLAAGLACVLVPWMLALRPVLGSADAWALFLCGALGLEIFWAAPDLRRGLWAGALAAGLLLGGSFFVSSMSARCVAAVGLLGVVRSGLLGRRKPLRALAIETMLLGGGVVFASIFAGPRLLEMATAVWAFLLVQALHPALGGGLTRWREVPSAVDAYEEARRKALELLEPLPGR